MLTDWAQVKIGDLVVMNIEYIAAKWGKHAAARCEKYSTGIVLEAISQDGIKIKTSPSRHQLKKYRIMWASGLITTEHWSHVNLSSEKKENKKYAQEH